MIRIAFGAALISILSIACSSEGDGNGTGNGGASGGSGLAGSGGSPGVAGSGPGGSTGAAGSPGAAGSTGAAGDSGNTVAGVSRTKTVSSLTASEKTALCDWYAPQVGGYGAAPTCSMALISAPASQAACLADFPACTATVGNLADCFTRVIQAQTACTNVQGTAISTPACISASACL
jgi:pilus assembly protein FimV